jgi:acyl-CoA synthetase (AMP-forming)/AMP-acid ligase II
LADLGVEPGTTVGVAVSDPLDFATVFLAAMAAGRVVAPLDARAPDRELQATCSRVHPTAVLADRPAPSGATCEWVELPTGSFHLRGAGGASSCSTAPDSDTPLGGESWTRPIGFGGGAAAPGGLVLSTSGTTGTPKVITLDERQLLHAARQIAGHHRLAVIDRGFNPLPLFHINAEVVGLLASLVAGSSLVLDDRFHRRGLWELLTERNVTWINAVPAIISRLAPLLGGETVPTTLRFVRSASAPLPPAVADRFEHAVGVPVIETYGMTEAASQITANPLDGPRKPGSVGRPVGVEVRVVGERREPATVVPPGTEGRVEIRGSAVIGSCGTGPADRVDAEGWLDTGDIGFLDEDGYLFLVGRVDDVINRGGEKVFPREVEEVILGDPEVSGTAVVGWDHHELGRVPVAFLEVGRSDTEDLCRRAERIVARVRERCDESLSRAKRPVAFHVVERLPVGSTGKVRRSAIDAQAAVYSLLVT